MKVLITGASGFLGGHVLQSCLLHGHRVRALLRPGSRLSGAVKPDTVEIAVGDLRDGDSVARAVEGIDAVVHAGAKVTDWGAAADFEQVNVQGTRRVVEACARLGVRRLVHVSTPSVVFTGGDQLDATEDLPYPPRFASQYAASKARAEQIVLGSARRGSLSTVILRPHAIWGPHDTRGYFPRLLAKLQAGRLPLIVATRPPLIDLTYVDNAAHACVLALDAQAVDGRSYFITDGDPVELWSWVERLCALFAIPPPRRQVSVTTALLAASIAELWARLPVRGARRSPPLTRYAVRLLSHSSTYCIDAARRDLGYTPIVGVERGLDELRRWVAAIGGLEALLKEHD